MRRFRPSKTDKLIESIAPFLLRLLLRLLSNPQPSPTLQLQLHCQLQTVFQSPSQPSQTPAAARTGINVNSPALIGLLDDHFMKDRIHCSNFIAIRLKRPGRGCGREALNGDGAGFNGEEYKGRGGVREDLRGGYGLAGEVLGETPVEEGRGKGS